MQRFLEMEGRRDKSSNPSAMSLIVDTTVTLFYSSYAVWNAGNFLLLTISSTSDDNNRMDMP